MCYTEYDSIVSYSTGTILSSLLIVFATSPSFKAIGIFLLFMSQMQFFDALFWRNLPTETCPPINRAATKAAILFNHLQPIVLLLAQASLGIPLSALSLGVGALYAISALGYTAKALQIDCTHPKGGILNWAWNHLEGAELFYGIFLLSLVASSLNFRPNWLGILAAACSLLTFFAASKQPILNQSLGRAWCYFAAFSPAIFLVLNSLYR